MGAGRGYDLAKKQKLPATCKAAWKGDLKKLKKALKKGDVNELDKDKRSALHYAAAQGHSEVLQHLLADPAIVVNPKDDEGKTPLMKACECNHVETVQIFLDAANDLDMNMGDNSENNPLTIAVVNENVDIASLLVLSDADVNFKNGVGETPLLVAVKKNNLELVELLASENADINAVDSEGRSALMVSVKNNYMSISKYLLSLYPDTSIKDNLGWTAFDFAQVSPDNTCLRLLEHHESEFGTLDYNLDADNITTINSQDEAVNHRHSANDWTAPPDDELSDNSFLSSPMEFNGKTSPDVVPNREGQDIEIDVDQVLTTDKSVSEVDLSISIDKQDIHPDRVEPGNAVNKLLDKLNESETSGGRSSPEKTLHSLGEISHLNDDDSSVTSSEEMGLIPIVPISMSSSEHSDKHGDDDSLKSAGSRKKELPQPPRVEPSQSSTPKASPAPAGYIVVDDDSSLSSITEKTEPYGVMEAGEIISPDVISPLPENTLSDSISINSDIDISGYVSGGERSGRKSVSPKGETPSDFRISPNDMPPSERSISSGVKSKSASYKRTPESPQISDGIKSSIADGVKRRKSESIPTSKVQYGSMLGDGSDSDDTLNESFERNSLRNSRSENTKPDINDLSIVSQSKNSPIDKNILNSARSSPNKLKKDFPDRMTYSQKSSEIITDDISGIESDGEAEQLLVTSGRLLDSYSVPPPSATSSMKVDVVSTDIRVAAAAASTQRSTPLDEMNTIRSPTKEYISPGNPTGKGMFGESSSDESETGKVAKKYLAGKKSRESSQTPSSLHKPSSSNSNYASSVSPMEGEFHVSSIPPSKQPTPRVSFGNAPICFTEPDQSSTPIKSKDNQDPSSSSKYEDIERRKSEAERDLEEIRRSRRSQSPISMSESVLTDSRNNKPEVIRSNSRESGSSVGKEDMPFDGNTVEIEKAVKRDLEANPGLDNSARIQDHMASCAKSLNDAVAYMQTLDPQTSPVTIQLNEQLKSAKRKLDKAIESKQKSENLRRQLEANNTDLRRQIESLSKVTNTEGASKTDLELELRSLQFKYEQLVEDKKNMESNLHVCKGNLKSLEEKQQKVLEDYHQAELGKKQYANDLRNAEQSQKALQAEIDDMKKLLEEEHKTRLIQEEMFNDQLERSRDLTSEASKSFRQKQDMLQQLTEADELCRNAENRNKSLALELSNLKQTYEADSIKWKSTELDLKTTITDLQKKLGELEVEVKDISEKLVEKDNTVKSLEEKLNEEQSQRSLEKHGFTLKENELETANKHLSGETQDLKLKCEKLTTELGISEKRLEEMESKLQQAEEIGTSAANDLINNLNQKVGEAEAQLRFKTQEMEEGSKKLRDAEENNRQLQLKLNKAQELQKLREDSFSADTDHILENVAAKDDKIRQMQLEIGELEEKLAHSGKKVKDIQFDLDQANKMMLEKNGAALTSAERELVQDRFVSSLENQLDEERTKYNNASHELELIKCKFERLTDENQSLCHEIEQLKQRIDLRDESATQVNEKLSETRAQLLKENDKSREELKRKNEALQDHISELRKKLVSAEAVKDMGEIEINRLKQEVKQIGSSLRVKEETFKQSKTNFESKNGELCDEVKKMEKKLQALYADRLHLKNDLSNSRDKFEEELTSRKDLERQVDSLNLINNNLNNEIIELKGNLDRESQNKGHYCDLYKSEQDYSKQLKGELIEVKKSLSSMESLNGTLKSTIDEIKDSNREEKMGRTLASKELDETRQMLDNEIKTRSHIGSRINNLERENQELNNNLHMEQKKIKKLTQAKKTSEATVSALQENLTDLHKDVGKFLSFFFHFLCLNPGKTECDHNL